jgi:hypothetical protein
MVEICYIYSIEKDGEKKVVKTEKAFTKFPDMPEAKKWARTKWNFLRWPDKKTTSKHTLVHEGRRIIVEGWNAKKDMGVHVDHFELTMTESYKES